MTTIPLFGRGYVDAYREHFDKHGFCPVEAGLIGKLADNECPHGALPGDSKPTCECHPEPKP